jgi:succinoglycan biosynthesis protein ExoO
MPPVISICVPVFNGVEYLEECLDSVKAQTWTDWELIVGINGHGPDGGAVAVIASVFTAGDPRMRVVVQPPHINDKVKSCNDLVANHAQGEWIAMLDCDDKWAPTKLEQQMRAKQGVAKDAGVIGPHCVYFGQMTGSPHIPSGWIDPRSLAEANPLINSSVILHRSLCHWRHTELCNITLEDYDLWMRLALAGVKMYNLPELLTFHRIHPASAFNSKGQDPAPLQRAFAVAASRTA